MLYYISLDGEHGYRLQMRRRSEQRHEGQTNALGQSGEERSPFQKLYAEYVLSAMMIHNTDEVEFVLYSDCY